MLYNEIHQIVAHNARLSDDLNAFVRQVDAELQDVEFDASVQTKLNDEVEEAKRKIDERAQAALDRRDSKLRLQADHWKNMNIFLDARTSTMLYGLGIPLPELGAIQVLTMYSNALKPAGMQPYVDAAITALELSATMSLDNEKRLVESTDAILKHLMICTICITIVLTMIFVRSATPLRIMFRTFIQRLLTLLRRLGDARYRGTGTQLDLLTANARVLAETGSSFASVEAFIPFFTSILGRVIGDGLNANQQAVAVGNMMVVVKGVIEQQVGRTSAEALRAVTEHSTQRMDEMGADDGDELQVMGFYMFIIHVMSAMSLLRTIYSLLGGSKKSDKLASRTATKRAIRKDSPSSVPKASVALKLSQDLLSYHDCVLHDERWQCEPHSRQD